MPRKKPHVVIFFGGETANRQLSHETGLLFCQYIPRSTYQVTPVHIQADGTWQVPLGSLPQQGPVKNMMGNLFQSLRSLTPVEGVKRLLERPVDAFLNVVRGRGGDDGQLHQLGQTLNVPVAGSPADVCHLTYHKNMLASHVEDITSTPFTLTFPGAMPVEDIVSEVREQLVPPLFIKPVHEEGSAGIERIENLDELAAAVQRAQTFGNVLVQETARGQEINCTLIQDQHGRLTILPPTLITPKAGAYYDHLAKHRPGRVNLQTVNEPGDHLTRQVATIAHDVFHQLDCRGYASLDFIADNNSIDLLEVNTIPTLSAATPLHGQLTASGIHPGTLIDRLIRGTLY